MQYFKKIRERESEKKDMKDGGSKISDLKADI